MKLGPVTGAGVLVAYGDYGANPDTGIDIIAISQAGVATTLLAGFNTEQTIQFSVLSGGWIWCPSVDPRGSEAGSVATNVGGTWHVVPVYVPGKPVAEHIFDVADSGGHLFLCGSHTPDTAFVWRSVDGGATWTEDLAYPSGLADGFNRFYEFRRSSGALIVSTPDESAHFILQSGAWVPATDVDFDAKPQTYDRFSLPGGGIGWTDSRDPDGSTWLCDGDAIYLLPPPD